MRRRTRSDAFSYRGASNGCGAERIGRPPIESSLVGVRLPVNELAALNAWIAKQNEPRPPRLEAIRHHLKRGLASGPTPPSLAG
jgi:hypothetical protein